MKKLLSLLTALCLLFPGLAAADSLPLDFSPAPVPNEANYLNDHEYQDDTLHVWIEDIERDNSVYHVAHVEVADPGQLRAALSCDPGDTAKAPPA